MADLNNSKFIIRNQSSKRDNYYKKEKLEMRRQKLKGFLDKEKEFYDSEMSSKNFEREKHRKVKGNSNEKIKLETESNKTKIINHQLEEEIRPNQDFNNKKRRISIQSSNRPLSEKNDNYNIFNQELPKFSLKKHPPKLEDELDNHVSKYTQNLEKLKYEDFLTRKKMQDDLLSNINIQMDKLKYGLNDKSYEEKAAQEWIREYTEKINNYDNKSYMNYDYLIRFNPTQNFYFDKNKNNYMHIKSPLINNQESKYLNHINNHNKNFSNLQPQINSNDPSQLNNFNP